MPASRRTAFAGCVAIPHHTFQSAPHIEWQRFGLAGKGPGRHATEWGGQAMQRITITIDDDLLEAADGLMARRGSPSRSEAFRDIVRDMVDRQNAADPKAACIATLSYVFDHATRD